MSPFSSNEKNSPTLKIKKLTIDDILKKNKKDKKKACLKKLKSPDAKTNIKSKQKLHLSPRIHLENEILRLQAGKITQQSYNSFDSNSQKANQKEAKKSLCKKSLSIQIKYNDCHKFFPYNEKVSLLSRKIKNQCKMNYPTLAPQHQKFLSCVILVQRLWRQKQALRLIKSFSTPASQVKYNFGGNFTNICEKTNFQISDSYPKQINFPSEEQCQQLKQCDILTFNIIDQNTGTSNLADLQISKQLSLSNDSSQQKYQRFVQNYRQFNLTQRKVIKKKESSFNFPISMSEKCLMEKFYRRVFKFSSKDKQKVKFFTSSKNKAQLNSNSQKQSQELIFEKKDCVTVNDKQSLQILAQKLIQVQQSINPQQKEPQIVRYLIKGVKQRQAQLQSFQNISDTSSAILQELIQQFLLQFTGLKNKNVNKERNQVASKRVLPGIQTSTKTIRQFLKGFVQFIIKNHLQHIQKSFDKVNALTFLKLCRPQPLQYLFQDEDEQQTPDWSLLPNTAFFEYQNIFQKEILEIQKDDKKYTNFVLSLSKIHNKCLHDALLQIQQINRSSKVLYSWDHCRIQSKINKSVPQLIKICIEQIVQLSNCKLGSLNVMTSYDQLDEKTRQFEKQQLQNDKLDWNIKDQKLQYRLELTDLICNEIMRQMAGQLLQIKIV